MRKTKIICTLGPSTDKDGVLRELVASGMNVARFNFSHRAERFEICHFTLCFVNVQSSIITD